VLVRFVAKQIQIKCYYYIVNLTNNEINYLCGAFCNSIINCYKLLFGYGRVANNGGGHGQNYIAAKISIL
jgi:hypothetical protein